MNEILRLEGALVGLPPHRGQKYWIQPAWDIQGESKYSHKRVALEQLIANTSLELALIIPTAILRIPAAHSIKLDDEVLIAPLAEYAAQGVVPPGKSPRGWSRTGARSPGQGLAIMRATAMDGDLAVHMISYKPEGLDETIAPLFKCGPLAVLGLTPRTRLWVSCAQKKFSSIDRAIKNLKPVLTVGPTYKGPEHRFYYSPMSGTCVLTGLILGPTEFKLPDDVEVVTQLLRNEHEGLNRRTEASPKCLEESRHHIQNR